MASKGAGQVAAPQVQEMIFMATLIPRRNNSLIDAFFSDPFDTFFEGPAASRPTQAFMRTDIKEQDGGYELTIDLPGFNKENVKADLKEGVLTVTAETKSEADSSAEKGTFIRKERFSGKCSRSYYVGDDIEEADIKARFQDGTLQITVPKKQPKPQLEASTSIAID